MRRNQTSSLAPVCYCLVPCLVGVGALIWPGQPLPGEDKPTKSRTVWPGPQPDGRIQLPNQWSLRPTGVQLELGDFPVNMALHPTGRWLAILHAGHSEHEVIIVDVQRRRITCRAPIEQTFYGLSFSPAGDRLFASSGKFAVVHEWQLDDGLLYKHRTWPVADDTSDFVCSGIALDAQRQNLYAAGVFGDAIGIRPLSDNGSYEIVKLPR